MKKICRICSNVTLFKILFLISALLYTLPIVNVYGALAVKYLLVWGLLLICYLFYKGKLRVDNTYFIIFFILVLVSIIVNYQDGLTRNFKDFLYLLIEILVLTSATEKKSMFKSLIIINHILIVILALGSIASLLVFLLQIPGILGLPRDYIFAYSDGRLWGWCGNPNTLAYMSIFSFIAMYINYNYYKVKTKVRTLTIVYAINAVLSLSCLALSASRSGFIGFFVIVAILALKPYLLTKGNYHKRFLICLAVCAIAFIGLNGLEKGLKYLPGWIDYHPATIEIAEDEREIGGDYSNGRFDLWKGGLQVAKEHLLFGVGQNALNEKVNGYLPPDYVKKAPKISTNMHNIYLQILSTMGIIAFLAFLMMFLVSAIKHRKEVFTSKCKTILFAMISSMLLMNFFDSNIIGFMNLFLCSIFWIYFGFFINEDIMDENIVEDAGRKRVLFLINNLGVGGAERVLIDIVNHFDHSIYDVSVKTLFNEGAFKDKLIPEIKYKTILKKPSRWKKAILWRFVKYAPPVCNQYFITENADVLVAFLEGMPTKIVGSLKNSNQSFCWIHTDIVNNAISETNFRNNKQAVACYQKIDKIICVSNDSKKRFLEVYPEFKPKTEVIYNCLNAEQILLAADEEIDVPFANQGENFMICCVGRLIPEKGYARFIEVVDKLIKNGKQIELMIIGDGDERGNLCKDIQNKGLDKHIHLLGFKENPYAYMKRADLFVCSSFAEGFSLVVIESLIIGTPVLSTACAGPLELLSDDCGIVCENSAEGLYNALSTYIETPPTFDRERIESRVSKFTINETLKKLEKLLEGD